MKQKSIVELIERETTGEIAHLKTLLESSKGA